MLYFTVSRDKEYMKDSHLTLEIKGQKYRRPSLFALNTRRPRAVTVYMQEFRKSNPRLSLLTWESRCQLHVLNEVKQINMEINAKLKQMTRFQNATLYV